MNRISRRILLLFRKVATLQPPINDIRIASDGATRITSNNAVRITS